MEFFAVAMAVAMVVDTAFGWPRSVFDRIGHPVTWLGRLIRHLDEGTNIETDGPGLRRAKGAIAWLAVVAAAVIPAMAVAAALPSGWLGAVLLGILAWPLVALRSLYAHVAAVAAPLERADLEAARQAVSMIVGRDTALLDEAGISRAAIESLAENASDGVVAPIFWGALFGLPGIAGYKAVNTLDSMIGHRTSRHEAFGWASARIDDLANLVPARLTAVLFAMASGRLGRSLRCAWRDAGHHRSPNAGWPEAAMAGAIGVRLSGPRVYHDRVADEPWINENGTDASATDMRNGLRLYVVAMGLLAALCALLAVAL